MANGKPGAPSIYTPELAEEICHRLAQGESLRSICRDEGMPDRGTVLRWVVKPDHPFTDLYIQAREAGGYADADDISELVQEIRSGAVDEKAGRVMLQGMIWLAERKAPKKHSPRQELTGPEGAPVGIQTSDLEGLSPEARKALRDAAEALVKERGA
jgi:hypothetical protein